MLNLRRFLCGLLATVIFIAFSTRDFWIHWTFIAFIVFMVLLITELFLGEEEFANSPNYDHWKQLKDSRLIEFESDTTSKDKKKLF